MCPGAIAGFEAVLGQDGTVTRMRTVITKLGTDIVTQPFGREHRELAIDIQPA